MTQIQPAPPSLVHIDQLDLEKRFGISPVHTFVRPSFSLVLRIHTVVQAWRSQHAANVSLLEMKDVVNKEGAAKPLLQET